MKRAKKEKKKEKKIKKQPQQSSSTKPVHALSTSAQEKIAVVNQSR